MRASSPGEMLRTRWRVGSSTGVTGVLRGSGSGEEAVEMDEAIEDGRWAGRSPLASGVTGLSVALRFIDCGSVAGLRAVMGSWAERI